MHGHHAVSKISPFRTFCGHLDMTNFCAISEDGEIGLSTSEDGSCRLWNLTTNFRACLSGHSGASIGCSLSYNGSLAATSGADGTVRIWQTDTATQLQTVRVEGYDRATACALTPSGQHVAISFTSSKCCESQFAVVDWRSMNFVTTWRKPVNILAMAASADLRAVSYIWRSPGAEGVAIANGRNGTIQRLCPVSGAVSAHVDVAANGSCVVVADRSALRVLSFANEHVMQLPGYTKSYSIRGCSITSDGSYVVAAVSANEFRVWETGTGTVVVSLAGHENGSRGCAIASSTLRVLTCSKDKTVRLWYVPSRSGEPSERRRHMLSPRPMPESIRLSPLENALLAATTPSQNANEESLLSEDMLLRSLKRSHVQCVADLVAGHNLVLLALRAGIITRENVNHFGGKPYLLMDELYFPVHNKLNSASDVEVIKVIGLHAQELGIINDGYTIVAATQLHQSNRAVLDQVNSVMIDLSRRIAVVEGKMGSLMENMNAANAAINEVSSRSEQLMKSSCALKESLADLHMLLKANKRRSLYTSLARCMLSCIPIFGSALGEGASALSELFLNMTSRDLVNVGVNFTKGLITHVAPIDLSNFQVARFAFSASCLGSLGKRVQDAVLYSVGQSPFRTTEALQLAMRSQIERHAKDRAFASAMDLCRRDWLDTNDNPVKRELEPIVSEVELSIANAQKQFNSVVGGRPERTLTHNAATRQLYVMLVSAGITGNVTERDVTLALEKADADKSESITEDKFISAFKAVMKEAKGYRALVPSLWRETFLDASGGEQRLRARQSARILGSLVNDFRKKWKNDSSVRNDDSDVDDLEQILASRADASGWINLDLFLDVGAQAAFSDFEGTTSSL